jgi:CBS domain-containing protein
MAAFAAKAKESLVKSIMTRPAVTVPSNLSLESLAQLFLERGLSRVPVVDEGKLVGVVTKTDLVERQHEGGDAEVSDPAVIPLRHGGNADLPGFHVHGEPGTVSEVMSRCPVTVTPEVPVWFCALMMSERGLHGLPVVTEEGKVVGMVSSLDVARWASAAGR